MKLTMMAIRLADDVPQYDSVPNELQYQRCIEEAVADYSRRRPRHKVTTLSIVAGTAAYDLPADFVKLIRVAMPLVTGQADKGVLITSDGLVPLGEDWEEHYTIAAGKITFHPTPTYATTRDVWYAAGYVLDASGEYAELPDNEVEIVLHKAAALAYLLQAGRAAREAWQYAIGDERVNKEKMAEAFRDDAKAEGDAYLAAIKAAIGPAGVRSRYDLLGR
jgi:hypothetical protein